MTQRGKWATSVLLQLLQKLIYILGIYCIFSINLQDGPGSCTLWCHSAAQDDVVERAQLKVGCACVSWIRPPKPEPGPTVGMRALTPQRGLIDKGKRTPPRGRKVVARGADPNRSDGLTTTDPTSAVAGFRFLPPTPAQRTSYHTASKGDSAIEFSWVPDLGSVHPMALIELTAGRCSTTSSLIFPSVHPLDMPVWNEGREVKVPQPEASYS